GRDRNERPLMRDAPVRLAPVRVAPPAPASRRRFFVFFFVVVFRRRLLAGGEPGGQAGAGGLARAEAVAQAHGLDPGGGEIVLVAVGDPGIDGRGEGGGVLGEQRLCRLLVA